MGTVAIHPPKAPITSGFNKGTAKNTVPNVCKMPGPPAPFVPTPLPNIAKSNMSPKGFSKDVKIEGKSVAIFGASFKSMGDVASKATGGGLLSMNTHGPAKFISPGSLTVKIEGKAVHLKGEPMLNNLGAAGAPPNTGATLSGVDRSSCKGAAGQAKAKANLECGEVGTYAELQKKAAKPVKMERDHVPSAAALFQRAQEVCSYNPASAAQLSCMKSRTRARGLAIAIPKKVHRGFSPTCGSRNRSKYPNDARSADAMNAAKRRDTDGVQKGIDQQKPDCSKAYAKAAAAVKEFDQEKMIKKVVKECKSA